MKMRASLTGCLRAELPLLELFRIVSEYPFKTDTPFCVENRLSVSWNPDYRGGEALNPDPETVSSHAERS